MNVIGPLIPFRRRRAARRAAEPLRSLLSDPWPDGRCSALEASLLALDLETTGLDPKKDAIVSAAWVPVVAGRVRVAEAESHLVHIDQDAHRSASSSILVHGIGHDRTRGGKPLETVLLELCRALRGRVLLAHHASFDAGFVSAACERLWGAPLVVPGIDTLALLRRMHERRHQAVRPGDLTLAAARSDCGLPRYPEHEALSDALAVAELWLALSSRLAGSGALPLARVLEALP